MADVSLAPDMVSPRRKPPLRLVRNEMRHPSRLKICFIAETFHAGVGRHVTDAVCGLSERGHEVHLLYSPIRCDEKFLQAVSRQPGVQTEAIVMPRAVGRGDFTAFRQIARYVRANGPFDVVHGHSSKGGGYARLLKLAGARTVVYSPHAFVTFAHASPAKKFFYTTLENTMARLTDRLVCTSVLEREHARSLGISSRRLRLVANGSAQIASPPRADIREALNLSDDQIVVGFVGRMEEQKAPERAIDMALRLLPKIPNLIFVMIGDGPKRAPLEAALQGSGIEDRVRWLGAADGRTFMPGMDMLFIPSLYEGFAYVFLEALYAGLPIVCTPVGGSFEAVRPGVNGMIVPHDEPERMAAAIRALATDGELRRAMSESSRIRAAEFTIPRMIDAMEDLYAGLLESDRREIVPLPGSQMSPV